MKRRYKKLDKIEIIIRPNIKIKSRQWLDKKILKTKLLLISQLPPKLSNLTRNATLTLLITNDKEIQGLNKKFRKKNKPTDVLSFHLNREEQTKSDYLGDMVISIETAKKQAKEKKTKLNDELLLLFMHGYLHLLGFDHVKPKEAKRMFELQDGLMVNLK